MISTIEEIEEYCQNGNTIYYKFNNENYSQVVVTGYKWHSWNNYQPPTVEVDLLVLDKQEYNYNLYAYSGQVHTTYKTTLKITLPCAELFSYNPIAKPTERVDPNDLLKGLVSE